MTSTSLPTVAGKNENRGDAIYEEALHKMKETGSVSKFRKYLSKHGVSYNTTDQVYTVTKNNEDSGLSAQYLDQADLQIWLTLSRPNCDYPDRYRAEISFDWSWQGVDDWGDYPDDVVGMTFSDRHFWIPDQNGNEFWTSGSNIDYKSQGSDGIGFSVFDAAADDGSLYSGGCKLRTQSGTSDPLASRKVYGQYTHTYSGTWSGLSFSVGMIGISWSSSGGAWDTHVDQNDDPLVVNAASLDSDNCDYGM